MASWLAVKDLAVALRERRLPTVTVYNRLEGRPRTDGVIDRAASNIVTPGYFAVMGMRWITGDGLAPLADDSGARAGRRHIRGGRASIRSILFLIADIARRFDESLAAFHRKLTAAGKPKMVVRIALARKLLVRLNAKAREAREQYALAT